MGSANVEVVSRCLPPRAIGLERLAQGRTYELISVLHTHVFSRPGYTYMLLLLIRMQSGVLGSQYCLYPLRTPGLDSATYCVVANLVPQYAYSPMPNLTP